MHGCKIGSQCPVVRAKRGQLHPMFMSVMTGGGSDDACQGSGGIKLRGCDCFEQWLAACVISGAELPPTSRLQEAVGAASWQTWGLLPHALVLTADIPCCVPNPG
jgi:hypothetical protein